MIKIKPHYQNLLKPNLPSMEEIMEKYAVTKIYKLNYNENRFGATPQVQKIFKISNPHLYPTWNSPILSKVLGDSLKLSIDHIFITNGSDAVLDLLPELFTSVTKNQNVIIPALTYKRIEQTCIIKNIEIKKIPMNDGYIDLDLMLKTINPNTAMIYIVNPNMPTGRFHQMDKIKEFLDQVPNDILVVIDEAYFEYSVGISRAWESDNNLIKQYENVLITRTFSKLFGLASFRIGYCIARPYIISLLKSASQYLPLSKFSEEAAVIAIDDQPYYDEVVKNVEQEKEFLYKSFRKLKIDFYESFGNFVYVKWSPKETTQLWEYLIKKYQVLIRIVENNAFRITIGTHAENLLVVQGFKDWIHVQGR